MRLDLETEIRFPTGERAGILRQVVLDENNEVRHIVMSTAELVSRDLLVPVEMLVEEPEGVLTIDSTPEGLDTLPEYQEESVPAAPEGWEIGTGAAPGGDVFPATIYQPILPIVEVSNLPEGTVGLTQGSEVRCLDGRCGVVDEVLVDEEQRVYGFIARPDEVGEHDRVVPLGLVQQIDPDAVTLNCTLADLPVYTQETADEHEEPEPS